MTPADKHRANQGETEPLPDALRDMLLSPAAQAPLPGLPPEPTHRNGRPAPSIARGRLSNRQKQVLCQLAAAAYAFQAKHGIIDQGVKLDAWRRAEQLAAVGVASLRDARQAHYLPLRGHFAALAGLRDAPTLQSLVAPSDDPDRQAAAQALRTSLAACARIPDADGKPMGQHRAEAYLLACSRHKGAVPPATVRAILDTWPVARIWALVYTLRNRTAAKKGVGHTRDRNKSQRRP